MSAATEAAAATAFPYFVVVQSGEFAATTRRLVVPLTRHTSGYPPIAPAFIIKTVTLVADALLMFPIPMDRLGPVVASLADEESAASIINAIDRAISRAFG